MKTVKGLLYLILALPVTLLALVLVTAIALVKLLLPGARLRSACTGLSIVIAEGWGGVCRWLYRCVHASCWIVESTETLSRRRWYLLICNHQSWTDIPVLLFVLYRRVPVFRFFVKRQLFWVPFVGLACWAMEFPFMRRYSREQLAENPALRRKDLQTTRAFCEKVERRPATIVNYLEGTRFSHHKQASQNSPYRHLLKPKCGGVAYVVTHLGERVEQLLDVTISYPGRKGFWAFLCGDLGPVRVHIAARTIPAHFKQMGYQQSAADRQAFQSWIEALWREKDARLERYGEGG